MKTFTIDTENGEPTIKTSSIVTHQQGSWKWQLRLQHAFYVAVYSERVKAWLWKSVGKSDCFSGGNIRNPHTRAEGSKHNRRLSGIELCALATVRGEC